jgi:hypothetical protein
MTKLTAAGNCIVMATTDTPPGIFVGIITAGAGKGGTQQLCFTGICPLAMDGTVTAGDCVIESTTSGGNGHDTGATTCNENAIGRVVNVGNAGSGAGTAFVFVFTTVPGVGVSDYSPKAYVAGAGTAQAQTAAYSPAVPALVNGLAVCWLPSNANTAGSPTLAVNGLTAKNITKNGTATLVANDLTTTAIACAVYDGTEFQLQNPQTAGTSDMRRICEISIGDTSSSSVISNGQLGPQKRVCYIPAAATLLEMNVAADGGTPNVIVGRDTAGTIVNVVSSALATAASGGIACSNTGGTTGLDGATTCSSTLQNTALAQGAYLELVSGTAGGTAKFMTIHLIYSIN